MLLAFTARGISKLLDLRSPFRRDVSLFHFVLMHLQVKDVNDLCAPEFLDALQSAHLRRAYTVHHDVLSHLEGFRHMENLVETGVFKGEKIPCFTPAQEGEAELSRKEDCFFLCMKSFVATSRSACAEIWKRSSEMLQGYREVSLYFEDPAFVYPPPKDDQDGKRDFFGLLHSFATDCARVKQDIEVLALATDVWSQCRFAPPYLDIGPAQDPRSFSEIAGEREGVERALPEPKPGRHDLDMVRSKMPSPQRPPHTLAEGPALPGKAGGFPFCACGTLGVAKQAARFMEASVSAVR